MEEKRTLFIVYELFTIIFPKWLFIKLKLFNNINNEQFQYR